MTAGGFPHSEILGSKPCWRLPEAYRSLKRPSSVLSAKHPPYALASNPHDPSGNGGKPQAHGKNSAGNTNHHTNDHTQNDQTPDSEESGEINSRRHPQKASPARVHYPVLKPPRTRTRAHPPHQGRATGTGHGTPATPNGAGWRSGNPKACPHHSWTHRTTGTPEGRLHSSTPATPTHPAHPGQGGTHRPPDSGLKSP